VTAIRFLVYPPRCNPRVSRICETIEAVRTRRARGAHPRQASPPHARRRHRALRWRRRARSGWHEAYEGLSNLADVHVGRVRRKLDAAASDAPSPLRTIRGAGYLFDDDPH
jgi:hypothetical protein